LRDLDGGLIAGYYIRIMFTERTGVLRGGPVDYEVDGDLEEGINEF